jgi:hypothetical protein
VRVFHHQDRTARISDLRRVHQTAGFAPQLRVGSIRASDSAGSPSLQSCGLVRDRLSANPSYICAI